MPSPTNEILNPVSLVLPNYTTTQRDLMVVELGTVIYNITTNKINICVVGQTAAAASWEAVTSA